MSFYHTTEVDNSAHGNIRIEVEVEYDYTPPMQSCCIMEPDFIGEIEIISLKVVGVTSTDWKGADPRTVHQLPSRLVDDWRPMLDQEIDHLFNCEELEEELFEIEENGYE